jgi:hypothetical protein
LAIEADSEQKWKQLVDLAIEKSQFGLAQEALHKAKDMGGLLLLASCAGMDIMLLFGTFKSGWPSERIIA